MSERAAALIDLATGGEPSLLQVLAAIVEHPHRELVSETPRVELEELTEPDTERFLELITDPGALSPAKDEPIHFHYEDRPYQFTSVFDARPKITFDTYPNRFVRHVVRRLRDALLATGDPDAQAVAARLDGLTARSALAECSPLHKVSADHNVLRKDPSYREVLRRSVELSRILAP